MALTDQQQARIDQLSAAKDAAQAAYDQAVINYTNAWNAAQDCQHKRDQYTLGNKKNQACHIDTLGQLNAAATTAGTDRDAKKTVLDNATNALNAALKEIHDFNDAGQEALQNDPSYLLETQKNDIEAAKVKTTTTRWFIIGGAVLIVLVIAGIIIYKKFGKK